MANLNTLVNTMSQKSRVLSFVLRHQPESVGLTLDPGGWVPIDDLLNGLKKAGHHFTRNELEIIVTNDNKSRYTISENGKNIRAAQGHSVAIELNLPALKPPDQLFHGTAARNIDAIRTEGIKPGQRRHVHLSGDTKTAIRVGQRHGHPEVLTIETGRMHADGYLFWQADNGVWLTDHVPAGYLGFSPGDEPEMEY